MAITRGTTCPEGDYKLSLADCVVCFVQSLGVEAGDQSESEGESRCADRCRTDT